MNLENVEKFKIEYLNSSKESCKTIAKRMGISKRELEEIKKCLNINSKRKRHYLFNESYFHNIDSGTKAYFLGLIAADGYIDDSRNLFVLTSINSEVLYKLLEEMNAEGIELSRDDGSYKNSGACYSIRISSKELVKDLMSHGIYHNKSTTYGNIPIISAAFLWDYLRGYIDGDGSVTFSYKTFIVKSKKYVYPNLSVSIIATQSFIDAVVKVFEIKGFSIQPSHTEGMFYLRISKKEELLRMYPLLYNEKSKVYFQRKKDKWDQYMWALNQK